SHRITVRIYCSERCLPCTLTRTLVRLLVSDEIGGDEESVFEVIDAEGGRLAVCHRAEVTRHLHPTLMRFLDRRAQLGAGDVHICLERGRARLGPEIHHPPTVGGSRQLVHLIEAESGTFEVGRGRVDPRTRLLAGIDGALDSEVTEAVQVAAGAHRCHAAREVESREALLQVRVDAGAGWVE